MANRGPNIPRSWSASEHLVKYPQTSVLLVTVKETMEPIVIMFVVTVTSVAAPCGFYHLVNTAVFLQDTSDEPLREHTSKGNVLAEMLLAGLHGQDKLLFYYFY